MRLSVPVLAAIAAAGLSAGCTWVHMAPGASAVRVMPAGNPPACEKRGEVAVSVKDSIAFVDRNALRVREELETLARNEAPGLGADTIQPLGTPVDGEQRFAAYGCGANPPVPAEATPDRRGEATTYPVGG